MFNFVLGAGAMMALAVFFPLTFQRLVSWVRSLWAKMFSNNEDTGDTPEAK